MTLSLRLTERKTLLILVDLILVNTTTLVALWIHAARSSILFDRIFIFEEIGWFFFLSSLWLLSALLNGFYDPKKITDLTAAASALLRTVALVLIVYLAIYFFFATPNSLPRGIVLYQGATGFILIGLWRTLYALLLQRPAFARKVIIVGAGWAGQTIAQAIGEYLRSSYRVWGFIDDDPTKQGQMIEGLPVLGMHQELVRLVKRHGVSEVILAVTHHLSPGLFRALLDCQAQGVQITPMPLLYEQLTGRVPIEHIGDNWYVALPLDQAGAGGLYPVLKRTFDIIGAGVGLALFGLIFPFIALAIYLDSPGPIFYRQERVGRRGKPFRLIKLRTMIPNAEKGQAVRAEEKDPRVTRVGRFLRKTRLDEFPQLINILLGQMSAVGPRPERPEHLAELEKEIPFHRLRNAVKPGMAGWAAVNYGYIWSLEDARVRLEYDLYYIKHQSIWLDSLILLKMFGKMFALRGR